MDTIEVAACDKNKKRAEDIGRNTWNTATGRVQAGRAQHMLLRGRREKPVCYTVKARPEK